TNGQVLQIGQTYTMSATPETGWLFADWSGGVSETSPALTFVMASNLVIIATFVEAGTPEPFTPIAGVFHGLYLEENFTDVTHAGFFTLTIGRDGRYGGTLHVAGKKHSARGRFAADGKATNSISTAAAGVLTVIWEADLDEPDIISGNVGDGAWVAPLYGDRDVFTSANPAPQAGKYTLIIPGTAGATESPVGDGYATVTVAANGTIRLKGKLADGTALVQNVPISKNGDWSLYDSLCGGRGVLLGWLRFADDGGNDLAGTLRWIKPAIAGGALYPAGFAVNSDAVGSHYLRPTGSDSVLQITDGLVILNGGNLPDSSNPETFGPKSKLVNNGPNTLKLIFTPASGLFRGTFKEAGTTQTIPLRGAVLQKQNVGSGYGIGEDQSGWIFFQTVPPP
ncbi:MAG TPA: hypothetical protein VK846_08880, partial [Candidatus Limnocylindria bacterium]|nr:hypothetical protein [Candidatus Limnocylindria bacterium]